MLHTNSKRKQPGFIKVNSMNHFPSFKEHSSSSEDFSSFEYNSAEQQSEEFSPYKHQINQRKLNTQISREPKNDKKRKQIESLFSNEKLKQNYLGSEPVVQHSHSQNYLPNRQSNNLIQAQRFCEKVKNLQNTKTGKPKYELQCQYSDHQNQNKNHDYYQYSDGSSEEDCEYDQFKANIVFKDQQFAEEGDDQYQRNRSAKKKFFQNASEDEEPDKYSTFKPKFNEDKKPKQKNEPIQKTKGGICYELNTNDFYGRKPNKRKTPKNKKKKTNTKEELLKRRQLARLYDRQARMRLFGS